MRRFVYFFVLGILFCSCAKESDVDIPKVDDPIEISSPIPMTPITRVTLDEQQQSFVYNGNAFAIESLKLIYGKEQHNMVFSPLSLQYVLSLLVNGATGTTAEEIMHAMGYDMVGVESINRYYNLLLNQLPALDAAVELKLADAMLVRDDLPVLDNFRKVAEKEYYSPIEYVDSYDQQKVIDRINEWAYRGTNGTIYPFVQKRDLSENFAAAVLNALYFKSPWCSLGKGPLFSKDFTGNAHPFYYDGGGKNDVDYMQTRASLRYGRLADNSVVEIPYADGKFAMYVVLPDSKGGDGLNNLLASLSDLSMTQVFSDLSSGSMVNLSIPKFEVSSSYDLVYMLQALGISKAFDKFGAEFDNMFAIPYDNNVYISSVMHKSRISVTEWGTEAASVTMAEMSDVFNPGAEEVDFTADHPFVYFIAEKTSGVILFGGVFDGTDK